MIIYAGQFDGSKLARLLSIKPFLFFGNISYSLYLWHWPLIEIYHYRFPGDYSPSSQITLFALSILFGYLSFLLIEKPARKIPLNNKIFAYAAIATMIALLSGYYLYKTNLINHYPKPAQKIASYLDYGHQGHNRQGVCFLTSGNKSANDFDHKTCLNLRPDKKNYLLIGDSHAAHFYDALRDIETDANILQANASGCKPVIDAKGENRCTLLMDFMFNDFIPANKLDGILLSARWRKEDARAVTDTLVYLRKFTNQIIVSGPIIEYKAPLPRLLFFNVTGKNISFADFSKEKEISEADAALKAATANTGANYFSVLNSFCDAGECKVLTKSGTPMQFDYGHLTYEGAYEVLQSMQDQGGLK